MRSTIVDSLLADIRDLLFREATRFFVNGLGWVDFVWNQNRLLLMVVCFHLTLTRLRKCALIWMLQDIRSCTNFPPLGS